MIGFGCLGKYDTKQTIPSPNPIMCHASHLITQARYRYHDVSTAISLYHLPVLHPSCSLLFRPSLLRLLFSVSPPSTGTHQITSPLFVKLSLFPPSLK